MRHNRSTRSCPATGRHRPDQEDSKGRLSDLVNPFGQTFHLEYDLDGKNTLVHQPNGAQEEKSYNSRDWLTSLILRQANGSVFNSLPYSYVDSVTGLADPTGHLR